MYLKMFEKLCFNPGDSRDRKGGQRAAFPSAGSWTCTSTCSCKKVCCVSQQSFRRVLDVVGFYTRGGTEHTTSPLVGRRLRTTVCLFACVTRSSTTCFSDTRMTSANCSDPHRPQLSQARACARVFLWFMACPCRLACDEVKCGSIHCEVSHRHDFPVRKSKLFWFLWKRFSRLCESLFSHYSFSSPVSSVSSSLTGPTCCKQFVHRRIIFHICRFSTPRVGTHWVSLHLSSVHRHTVVLVCVNFAFLCELCVFVKHVQWCLMCMCFGSGWWRPLSGTPQLCLSCQ